MTVAIDASRAADTQKTGVGWYTYHLIDHLRVVIPQDVRVLLYTDRPLPAELHPWPERWEERVLRWGVVRWPLWSQLRLAAQVFRDCPDVFVVPAHVIPDALACTRRCGRQRPRIVTTIHDVVFRQFPETYSPRERWYLSLIHI